MFEMAQDSRATHVGLGQFTSIVSENGLLLRNTAGQTDARITTGNSLTAGFAYEALVRALAQRGKNIADVRIGIVGANGNICNVLAQLIGDHASALTLVHRESLQESAKFREAVQNIIDHSAIDASRIRATNDPALLTDCDAVILGTNSTQKILKPEFLKKSAIVLDLSVPTNIDPRVFMERADVECFQGGLAQLPFGQMIDTPWIPTPKGETFACIAETLTTALLEINEDFSLGPITKERVLLSLEMAKQVGIELGSLRPLYRYPSSLSVSPAIDSTTSY
jgi:predicted amino acid dehydrogenase